MSYPSPNTEASSGERGDLVVANSRNPVSQALGIPPRRLSLQPDTDVSQKQYSPKTKVQDTPFNLDDLKDMIIDQENTVKIRPILLALSGFANCGKSIVIQHLLRHYVEESPYMPMSRKGYIRPTTKAQGITFYEVLAYGTHHLQLTEVTNEFSFAFGIMTAFKKTMIEDKVVPHFPMERGIRESKCIFEDADLENHLEYVYRHIAQFDHIPRSTDLKKEEERFITHLKKLPDGTGLMNIWDVTITSTSAIHYLNMLSGHLYNSNTWLFLDMEQDLDALDLPPPPEEIQLSMTQSNCADKSPIDISDHDSLLTNKWRPRLHYLLQASKLCHGGKKRSNRKGVCTVFARHGKIINEDLHEKVEELEEKVQQAARQIGVSELIESKIQPINLSDKEGSNDYSQKLYQKLKQVICNTQYEDIPLSWIFLRSLFYHQRRSFISKSDLQSKAKACGIEGESFDNFCHFFASFGSIIDFTLINPHHKLIVFLPIDFLRALDNILYPKNDTLFKEHPMMTKGIISESICQQIFEVSCSDYMTALISINLATKVTGACVKDGLSEKVSQTDTLYYVPQMRLSKSLDLSKTNPFAYVYFITSIDSPPISKHAKFVRHMLSANNDLTLEFHLVPCPEKNKTLLLEISTKIQVTFITFSSTTLIEVSAVNDKVYASVVKACHELAKPHETGIVKYQFAVMCANNKDITPCSLLSCHNHVIPTKNLSCEACHEVEYFDEKFNAWNRALEQNGIPESNGHDCQIKSGLTLSQLHAIAKEFELHPEFIPALMQVLNYTEDPPKSKGMEGKIVMEMLLDWEKGLNQIEVGNQRKEVAKLLLEMATHEDKKSLDFFLKVAKEFDNYAKYPVKKAV